MTYSCGMFFSSLCVNICTFPQKPNLTHVMQEQKCVFSASLKQTDVSSICQQVMRKLLLLQDIITYAPLLRRMLVFCGKGDSILGDVFSIGCKILTKSQNHGFVRNLWRSSRQALCSSSVSYSRFSAACPVEFWISPRMEAPQSLSHLQKCLTTITLKKIILYLNRIFCISSFAAPRRVRLCLHYSHHQMLIQTGEKFLESSFLQAENLEKPQFSFPSYKSDSTSLNHLCGPSLFPLGCSCPCTGCPGADTALQIHLPGAVQRGIITCLSLLAMLLLMQPRMLLVSLLQRHKADRCSVCHLPRSFWEASAF